MTRLATALLLLLLAASASGAEQKLDDKCCRISWRSRHTGFTGHGDWISEPLAMSRLVRSHSTTDIDEWIEVTSKGWFGRRTLKERRHLFSIAAEPTSWPYTNAYSLHVNILPMHFKRCPPGTHPVVEQSAWLNLETHKIEHHGKRRNWCRVDGPRREE